MSNDSLLCAFGRAYLGVKVQTQAQNLQKIIQHSTFNWAAVLEKCRSLLIVNTDLCLHNAVLVCLVWEPLPFVLYSHCERTNNVPPCDHFPLQFSGDHLPFIAKLSQTLPDKGAEARKNCGISLWLCHSSNCRLLCMSSLSERVQYFNKSNKLNQ